MNEVFELLLFLEVNRFCKFIFIKSNFKSQEKSFQQLFFNFFLNENVILNLKDLNF
jgi:hypothetical protein